MVVFCVECENNPANGFIEFMNRGAAAIVYKGDSLCLKHWTERKERERADWQAKDTYRPKTGDTP